MPSEQHSVSRSVLGRRGRVFCAGHLAAKLDARMQRLLEDGDPARDNKPWTKAGWLRACETLQDEEDNWERDGWGGERLCKKRPSAKESIDKKKQVAVGAAASEQTKSASKQTIAKGGASRPQVQSSVNSCFSWLPIEASAPA
jgi:hypothetical protein